MPGIARGAAFGDIDNDGDIDVVIGNNNGPARLLLNDVAHDVAHNAGWLELRLEGNGKVNRDALGARVTLYREGAPNLVRRVHTDSSYCSASDRRVHFGWTGRLQSGRSNSLAGRLQNSGTSLPRAG